MCARSATLLLITLLLTVHALTAVRARAASRTRFPGKLWNLEVGGGGIAVETTLRPPVGVRDAVRERRSVWRDLEYKEPPLSHSRRRRGRGHALVSWRDHTHTRLMRVGCVLGTCQVQNLSHRLYQLIGQRRRENSSPVNPRSPHSYG